MLEIGSYEGASACYLISKLAREAPIEMHCVDTWEGGIEHKLGGVDGRAGSFDLIYVDGSHQAPDVLADAVPAFKLLKVGGFMFFDDHLWAEDMPHGRDPLLCPKPAIDAFINCYLRKVPDAMTQAACSERRADGACLHGACLHVACLHVASSHGA